MKPSHSVWIISCPNGGAQSNTQDERGEAMTRRIAFILVLLVGVFDLSLNNGNCAEAATASTNKGTAGGGLASLFENGIAISWDDSVLLAKYEDAVKSYVAKGPEFKNRYEAWNKACLARNEVYTAFLKSVDRDENNIPNSMADLKSAMEYAFNEYRCMDDDFENEKYKMLGQSREAVLLTSSLLNRALMNLAKYDGKGFEMYASHLRPIKAALKRGDYTTAKRYFAREYGIFSSINDFADKLVNMQIANQ
jgi:hypothetical protein